MFVKVSGGGQLPGCGPASTSCGYICTLNFITVSKKIGITLLPVTELVHMQRSVSPSQALSFIVSSVGSWSVISLIFIRLHFLYPAGSSQASTPKQKRRILPSASFLPTAEVMDVLSLVRRGFALHISRG